MTKLRIIAAVVDVSYLTLYKEDGSTLRIPQGDPRIQGIIDSISPNLNQRMVAELDLTAENHYHDFEKKSGGLVKLFRIAKQKVAHIFGSDEPTTVPSQTIGDPTSAGQINKTNSAVAEIMQHAQPVADVEFVQEFTEDDTTEDTVVAVVTNERGENKIIPGMENIKSQFAEAAKLGSTIGVENFIKRLSNVIDKRAHSVQDVLTFMKKGDLPIADDGSIVAYKVLTTMGKHADIFYDCHTKKVQQKVGSRVFMKETLVDPNRRNECSNGLHIARRAYLKSFSGDVIVICKIAPEDVIAVPHNDANKVRVCGYHILGKIPASEHENLRANRPMTENTEAAKLLGAVLRGNHVAVLEEVEIGANFGGQVRITPLVKSEAQANKAVKESIQTAKKAEPAKAIADAVIPEKVEPVDPKKIAENVAANKNASPQALFKAKNWDALVALKRKKKISWTKLGFNSAEIGIIEGAITSMNVIDKGKSVSASELKKPNPTTVKALKDSRSGKVVKTGTVSNTMKELNKPEPKKKVTPVTKPDKPAAKPAANTKAAVEEATPETREQKARRYFELAAKGNKAEWTSLWLLKKQAKKSWEQLGFTKKEEERIKTNKPDHV